jgi:hypothetical protein
MKLLRALLGGIGALMLIFCAVLGCARCESWQEKRSPQTPEPPREITWEYEHTPVGRMNVVVLVPARAGEERFPVLVAFHGRGEALKGPERGARGWLDDYGILEVEKRLLEPPLKTQDFLGFVDADRLSQINANLKAEPYGGVIVACAYLADGLLSDHQLRKA